MTPAGRTRLRELAETATPGPWRTEYLLGRGNDLLTAILSGPVAAPRVVGSLLREQDGRYVAAVPPDVVLALLDALDAAEAGIEQVRALRRPDPTPDDAIAAWLTTPEQAARISPTPSKGGRKCGECERTSRQERDRRKSAELKTLREENRLLAAKVERVRALALNQSGPGRWARDEGWAAFVPAADLLRALDEEPQP